MCEISQGCSFLGFRQKNFTPPYQPPNSKNFALSNSFSRKTHINLGGSATKIRTWIGNSHGHFTWNCGRISKIFRNIGNWTRNHCWPVQRSTLPAGRHPMHSRLIFGPNAILGTSVIYSALRNDDFVRCEVTVVSSLQKSLIGRFLLPFVYFKEF